MYLRAVRDPAIEHHSWQLYLGVPIPFVMRLSLTREMPKSATATRYLLSSCLGVRWTTSQGGQTAKDEGKGLEIEKAKEQRRSWFH